MSKKPASPPIGSAAFLTTRDPAEHQCNNVWRVDFDGKTWTHRLVHTGETRFDAVRKEQALRISDAISEIEGKKNG